MSVFFCSNVAQQLKFLPNPSGYQHTAAVQQFEHPLAYALAAPCLAIMNFLWLSQKSNITNSFGLRLVNNYSLGLLSFHIVLNVRCSGAGVQFVGVFVVIV
ncbi:hypothetical protein T4E_12017 [Trichinella pseudospiralis]|uniref:Uncharacterized protein n=1 Tax=Trichinella pseudospiralis TaxID=6337 RepID=A0A0V0XHW5_TRIPS|nr:hypothetical protein T4E_1659 [Trichinella pseudospiralis]KRX87586.1 hypothetical protein T4E_12017 [Trichinella pseudospiralis]